MGRGRTPKSKRRKPKRKPRSEAEEPQPEAEKNQEPKPMYAVGDQVEVRSDEEGFRGSWFEATVSSHVAGAGGGSYEVIYSSLVDDNASPLHEMAAAANIRPRPRRKSPPRYNVYEMVEAFHNDGWWFGIVSGIPQLAPASEEKYTISFPLSREVIGFPRSLVRPHLEFDDGRWVPAQEHASQGVPCFQVGRNVEVTRVSSKYGYHWFPATIIKTIGIMNFLVQYRYAIADGELASEIVDSQYIRPACLPPLVEPQYKFDCSSEVEVLWDGGWLPGVVSEVVSSGSNEYAVKVKIWEVGKEREGEETLLVDGRLMRPRSVWDGKKWSCSTKRPGNRRAQFISGKQSISPASTTSHANDEITHGPSSGRKKRARKEKSISNFLPASSDTDEITRDPYSGPKKRGRKINHTEVVELQSLSEPDAVSAAKSEMGTPLQMSMSENHILKYESSLTAASQLEVPFSERISTAIVVQRELQQTSLFGTFGQPKSLPVGPVLGKQSLQQEESRLYITKEQSISQENQFNQMYSKEELNASGNAAADDEDFDVLPIAELKNFTSALKKEMKNMLATCSAQTFKELPNMLMTNSTTDISNMETDCGLVTFEKSAECNVDESHGEDNTRQHGAGDVTIQNEQLSSGAPLNEEVLPQQNEASYMDSTECVNGQNSPEGGIGGKCELNGQDDQPAEEHNLIMVECVTNDSSPMQNLAAMQFCGAAPILSNIGNADSEAQKDGNESGEADDEVAVLPISKNAASMEHESDGPSSERSLVVHEGVMINWLPSEPVPTRRLPFVKSSPIWASVEAMELFRRLPPQLHFLQLEHYLPEFREGMALGLMVSFANLAESIEKLHIQDSIILFEEKMRSLALMEANGFDVKILQCRLKKLLEIRNGQTEFTSRKKELEEMISNKEVDNNQLDAQINILNMVILELEQKTNLFREKLESLLIQRTSNSSEISRLKMDASELQVSYQAAEQHFNSVLVEPW